MATVTEINLEKSVNEFRYLKRAKLFSKDEIAELIRNRRHHEYALQKRTKRLHDFDAYIYSDMCLLKLIRIRRKKVSEYRFKEEIEKSIIARLIRLHRQLCHRFSSRVDVWLRFILLCERLGRRLSAERVWQAALRVHGRTQGGALWIAAAASRLGMSGSISLVESKHTGNESDEEANILEANVVLPRTVLHGSGRGPAGDARHRIEEGRRKAKSLYLARHILTDTNQAGTLARTTNNLIRAQVKARREVRMAWDRAWLSSLRDARQFLTQGIAINSLPVAGVAGDLATRAPTLPNLHLALARLELCAADFFAHRVRPRLAQITKYQQLQAGENQAEALGKISEQEGDRSTAKRAGVAGSGLAGGNRLGEKPGDSSIDKETRILYDAIDAEILLADVNEDIEEISSGSLFCMVINNLLEHWPNDMDVLKEINSIIQKTGSAKMLLGPKLVDHVFKRLNEMEQEKVTLTGQQSLALAVGNHATETLLLLRSRLADTHRAFADAGRDGVLDLWSRWGWYRQTSGAGLRGLDPKLSPCCLGLLRARLHADASAVARLTSLTEAASDGPGQMLSADEFLARQTQANQIVEEARTLLDDLTSSPRWAGHSADIWLIYVWFEGCVSGDAVRLPAIRWRARHSLKAAGNLDDLRRFQECTAEQANASSLRSLACP